MHKNSNIWGESHIGYKRKNNEDRFFIQELSRIVILAVADGLGGSAGGEIAAQHVIDAFRDSEFSKEHLEKDLADALSKAEKQIFNNVKKNPDLYGMGSTVTTAAVYQNRIAWIHVGDSRMYLLHDNKIKQITRDHTFLQDFIDDGTLTPQQAKIHPFKDMLDQCVGSEEIEPDQGVFTVEKNDRLLICSDGLTKHLSDLQIESILTITSVKEAGRQLIREALRMGGSDNITVIVKTF
jgi:serine/threonine protein phosphatase PrpC